MTIMKTWKIIIVFGMIFTLIPVATQAQDYDENREQDVEHRDVPEQVHTKFSHEYPQTEDTKWKMVDDAYVVEFTTAGGENRRVRYDKKGERRGEERKLDMERDLPQAVTDVIQQDLASYRIEDVFETHIDEEKVYRIEMERNGKEYQVYVDEEGNRKMPTQ